MENHSIDRFENDPGSLIAVCGNSGSGKSTLVRIALDTFDDLSYMKTCTTRSRRLGEDDTEYEFVSLEEYEERRSGSARWDADEIYGNHYGLDAQQYLTRMQNGMNHIVCCSPESTVVDGMKEIYGSHMVVVRLMETVEVSHQRSRLRDRAVNLGRLAVDRTLESDSHNVLVADFRLWPTGTLREDKENFINVVRRIIG